MRGKDIIYVSVIVVLLVLAFGVGRLSAAEPLAPSGGLDSPGPPESTTSYTLEDIYNRLDAGTAGAQSTFTEPSSGPTAGTGHTLDEIMAKAPAEDNINAAAPAQVLTSKTYWSLRTDGTWGTQTGTMPNRGQVIYTPGTSNQTVAAGYHDGSGYVAGDADLVGGNIRSGANIFGVVGDSNVVNTSSGDATAGDILSGRKAWVDGGEVTGSMPNRGQVIYSPGTSNQTVAAGYHNGSGYVEGDADLVADNIKDGIDIFGVTGTYPSAPVPRTGQTGCWNETGGSISCTGTGQDGEYQKGVAWPNPRFVTSTTGSTGVTVVVTDTLTGLVWLQDANCIQSEYSSFDSDGTAGDGQVTWQHALDFVAGINAGTYSDCGASFTDWRLPNVRELHSLVHYGFTSPAVPNTAGTGQWSEGDPFTGVQSGDYWSSTTYANNTSYAWDVILNRGHIYYQVKSSTYYVWPVRGGQ